MNRPRNDSAPKALAEQKRDFTAEGALTPEKLPSPPPPRQNRTDTATPITAKLHRDTLTLKRDSRAR